MQSCTIFLWSKGYTRSNCDQSFNELRPGTMGINIWKVKQSDVALVKKIEEYIGFKRLRGKNSRDWMDGLNKYHQDPKSGPILINHIFIFSKSYLPAIFKQKECYDDKAGECNLCPTNMPDVEHILYLKICGASSTSLSSGFDHDQGK